MFAREVALNTLPAGTYWLPSIGWQSCVAPVIAEWVLKGCSGVGRGACCCAVKSAEGQIHSLLVLHHERFSPKAAAALPSTACPPGHSEIDVSSCVCGHIL